jgi:hypothetical protein
MAAQPARPATATYVIGNHALTPAAVSLIIKRTALRAAEEGLVGLFGKDLDAAIATLSTHSLRVGLTQVLFAAAKMPDRSPRRCAGPRRQPRCATAANSPPPPMPPPECWAS